MNAYKARQLAKAKRVWNRGTRNQRTLEMCIRNINRDFAIMGIEFDDIMRSALAPIAEAIVEIFKGAGLIK